MNNHWAAVRSQMDQILEIEREQRQARRRLLRQQRPLSHQHSAWLIAALVISNALSNRTK